MKKTFIDFPQIQLSRNSKYSLQEQLYSNIRRVILTAQLRPGTRMPSTRALMEDLNISRNTAKNAYEQLTAEGYLVGSIGSGTYVSKELPEDLLQLRKLLTNVKANQSVRALSKRAHELRLTPVTVPRRFNELKPFRAWIPAFEEFPIALWSRLSAKRWKDASMNFLRYGSPHGYKALREAIASYLATSRGMQCTADQVIITAGSQHGLFLAAQILVDPGEQILMENPGYLGARGAFKSAGAEVIPLQVDKDGIKISLAQKYPTARALFLTPSHQYPLGVTMSLSRRLSVLEWAKKSNAFIIEDDYDSEFRYEGRPIPALFALDDFHRTIYVGSFSKVLVPSLRLGYLVVPEDLIESFLRARALIDRGSPSIEQAVLCDFINEGYFARHIRRMRTLYAEKQDLLIREMNKKCASMFKIAKTPIGMHTIAWLHDDIKAEDFSERAASHGLDLTPISAFYQGKCPHNGLLLGFTALSFKRIKEGVELLSRIDTTYRNYK